MKKFRENVRVILDSLPGLLSLRLGLVRFNYKHNNLELSLFIRLELR